MKKNIVIVSIVCILTAQSAYSHNRELHDFSVALQAFNEDFYDASESLFEKFLRQYPFSTKTALAKFYIAKSLFFKKEYERALSLLIELLSLSTAREFKDEVIFWMARVYFASGNYIQALKSTTTLIDEYPFSPYKMKAAQVASRVHLHSGDMEEAKSFFEKIIRTSTDIELIASAYASLGQVYYTYHEYVLLDTLVDTYIKKYPQGPRQSTLFFYRAQGYHAQARYREAIEWYTKALIRNNDAVLRDRIIKSRALSYLAAEEVAEAEADIEAIKDTELKLFTRGIFFFTRKDYVRSLDAFNAVLSDYPQSPYAALAVLNKAESLYELGRINDALYVYNELMARGGDSLTQEISDRARLGVAFCFLRGGHYGKAIRQFEETILRTSDPATRLNGRIQIADAYKDQGKFGKALDAYSAILKKHPHSVHTAYVLFQKAMVYIETDSPAKAKEILVKIRNRFPSSEVLPKATYHMAMIYFDEGKTAEAKSICNEFINRWPLDTAAIRVFYLRSKCFADEGLFEKALSDISYVVQQAEDIELKKLALIEKAHFLRITRDFKQARLLWKQLLRDSSYSEFHAFAYFELARLHELRADILGAKKFYQKLIDTFPSGELTQKALLRLGYLLWQEGDREDAIEKLSAAAAHTGKNKAQAQLWLAQIYTQKGRYQEALTLYEAAIRHSPQPLVQAVIEKGYLLKEIKNYSAAVLHFARVLEAGYDDTRLRFAYGFCLEKLKRTKEAIEQYSHIIYNLENDTAEKIKAYFRIARIHEKENDTGDAIKIYRRIVAYNRDESKIAQKKIEALIAP